MEHEKSGYPGPILIIDIFLVNTVKLKECV